ncbi:protein TolQ [Erythrobacteraceae bacterium CFH 75059]|uniref:protein TolQ n=1 Tax=Qipengyuania thermophila TaxID=2509361 RepID=UPI001021BFFC|nr:protein TolQ [Qipengyuania thermophila]TCD06263.1 protein TolQ [Erythrobacteraceae bacterium CFH 75059]
MFDRFLLTAAPTSLDPLELFLQADIVVKLVMIGLVVASIWVWGIIVAFVLRMRRLRADSTRFEHDFWRTGDFETVQSARRRRDIPPARVAEAAIAELRQSVKAGAVDQVAARERIATAMDNQIAEEADALSQRLTFLASVGAVAPFVGLFGTVWGIMNSFFQIGAQESSSLAVVAPGISEALFATAIGLFAAIPAVVAYNRFSDQVNRFEARLQRFAGRLHASLSRELEQEAA